MTRTPKKLGKTTIKIKHLQSLVLEILKTVNDLNPYYMKEILSKTINLMSINRPLDIHFYQNNTAKYKNNDLQNSVGFCIWNSVPSEMKEEI